MKKGAISCNKQMKDGKTAQQLTLVLAFILHAIDAADGIFQGNNVLLEMAWQIKKYCQKKETKKKKMTEKEKRNKRSDGERERERESMTSITKKS